MATKFEKIAGNDSIFNNKEYIADSIIFNSIESARSAFDCKIYSDHKNVIILFANNSPRIWLWTSDTIKDDTNKLIDICRFLRDSNVPKAEIYLKDEVAGTFSDLYALTTLEINYSVKDEFSLAVYTYNKKNQEIEIPELEKDEKIIKVDKDNEAHKKLVTDFYMQLKDEFRWNDKFERKVNEYLQMEFYALVKDGRMIANAVIGGKTEQYLRIKSIAVLSDERCKGFGYKMCLFALNKIRERNLTPILYTHVGNKSAVALWGKSGFSVKEKLYLLKIENND